MTTTIRDAALGDLPSIVEIYNACIPGYRATADVAPVTTESRRAWFKTHNPRSRPLWVLELDRSVVAWVSLSDFGEGRSAFSATAELGLYVHPDLQRKGYGRLLLGKILESCSEFGITVVLAMYFDHNVAMRKLCNEFGFADQGHLKKIAELDGRKRGLMIGVKYL